MPAVTLGLFTTARIMRLTRSGMLEVLGRDYIRTARAKRPDQPVVWKHALKNAAIPIVTIVGIELGTLLGGAVITETIFAWPGVGRLSVQAIYNRDYPVVQAAVFLLASTFVIVNLVVDVLYTYLDPHQAAVRAVKATAATPTPGPGPDAVARASRMGDLQPAPGPASDRALRTGGRAASSGDVVGGPMAHALRPRRAGHRRPAQAPGWRDQHGQLHPLGTDHLGRDLLARVIFGARPALLVGVAAVMISRRAGPGDRLCRATSEGARTTS